MPTHSRSRLIEHLLETLSLAQCLEQQDPPNPVTRAALQHSMSDLVAELEASDLGAHQGRQD